MTAPSTPGGCGSVPAVNPFFGNRPLCHRLGRGLPNFEDKDSYYGPSQITFSVLTNDLALCQYSVIHHIPRKVLLVNSLHSYIETNFQLSGH